MTGVEQAVGVWMVATVPLWFVPAFLLELRDKRGRRRSPLRGRDRGRL